eukprot:364673-Chlamydomonas_euryale.AAC.9
MAANMEALARDSEEYQKRREESKLNDYQGYLSDVWGSETADPASLDPKKVKEALSKLEKAERDAVDGEGDKRKFNSVANGGAEAISAEEMEAFRLKKQRVEDPLAKHDAGTSGYDLLE